MRGLGISNASDSDNSIGQFQRGVVAVVVQDGRFLVIRRSRHVAAPRTYCFPGGAIEPGESETDALVREIREELGVTIRPIRRVWRSVTPWDVELAWWESGFESGAAEDGSAASVACDESAASCRRQGKRCSGEPIHLAPNPREVESVHWLTPDEMTGLAGLLQSNHDFLDALAAREISLDGVQGPLKA